LKKKIKKFVPKKFNFFGTNFLIFFFKKFQKIRPEKI